MVDKPLENPYVLSQPLEGWEDLKVSELFYPVSKVWRHDTVHHIFNSRDANAVQEVFIHPFELEDKLI